VGYPQSELLQPDTGFSPKDYAVNAGTFVCAVVDKARLLQPKGYGKQWTVAMYPLLYEVGQDAGFEVNCHPFEHNGISVGYGEYHNIDFWFSERNYDTDGYIYRNAAVLVEHENNWDFESKRYDFLKLCMFIANLRVFMGYCERREQAEEQAKRLVDYYNDHELKQITDGETLIMVSWDDVAPHEWIAWSVRGGGRCWSRLEAR
jgi:hypothetical protein